MKASERNRILSALFAAYSAVLSLAVLLLAFPRYYVEVIAPSSFRQAYLATQMPVGIAVFTLVIAFAVLIRRKLSGNPRWAGIPALLLGGLVCLLPAASPAGLSGLLAKQVHWLTPTIVGNALIFAYILFVVSMGMGGITVSLLLPRAVLLGGASRAAVVIWVLLTGASVALINPAISYFGYDGLFVLAGAACAVCGLLSVLFGIMAGKEKKA